MLIFIKASCGKLVTVELELNTFVDILKYRISKDIDKYVVLARTSGFLNIIWRKNCQRMCIRHINKGYNSRPRFSEEQLRICLSIINYDAQKKRKDSVYGKIHKGFDKLYACLGWS